MRQGSYEALDYEAARLGAFALAVDGRTDDALARLNDGWTAEWPHAAAYAVDVARVRYLAGDFEHALGALELAVRGAERADPHAPELVRACVRGEPALWRPALAVALGAGTTRQRVSAAWGVLRTRFASR